MPAQPRRKLRPPSQGQNPLTARDIDISRHSQRQSKPRPATQIAEERFMLYVLQCNTLLACISHVL
jgi:hypothetical protein